MEDEDKKSGHGGSYSSWCGVQTESLAGSTRSKSEERIHHTADGLVEKGTVHLSLVVLDGWQLFADPGFMTQPIILTLIINNNKRYVSYTTNTHLPI